MTRGLLAGDRRGFGRRESFIHAVARIHGRPAEPCIVRNFSTDGALLEFPVAIEPSLRFQLVIDDKDFVATCEVRHHDDRVMGVRFLAQGAGNSLVERSDAAPVPSSADLTGDDGTGAASGEPLAVVEVAARLGEPRTVTRISGDELRERILSGA